MIDTHCHLDYLDDPASARGELGLTAMVCIGADVEHARNAIGLAERFGDVFATVGLHPTEAAQDSPEVREEIERLSLHPRVVGIGESGVDHYWDAATPEAQRAALEWQLDLARRRALPIVIHTRDKAGQDSAARQCADLLRAAGWHRGILHCFSGHAGLLRAGLDLGFYVSFAGNVTYKTAHEIREAATFVPRDRILVETDAPFLAPVPKRGRPNRPGYTRYTLQFLADLLSLSEAEFEALTDANARAVYRLDRFD
jgi:TatD DNase family protein